MTFPWHLASGEGVAVAGSQIPYEGTQAELARFSRVWVFFLTVSLRYNLPTIKFTCFKRTIK